MLILRNFLVIGSYSRNAGKTTFSSKIIKTMESPVIALKVTIIKEESLKCPRGGDGCGVCTTLESDFDISEEMDRTSGKDTSKLLSAGAEKVYWLRVREGSVLKGMEYLLKKIDSSVPVICESNSIMKYIKPSLFILLKSASDKSRKKSALSVEEKADFLIETTALSSNFDFTRLHFDQSTWSVKP